MNEVATTETKELSTEVLGVGADVDTWEIKLSYASLMQGLSKLVSANPRSVFPGEIRDSVSGELLGDENSPFEVIVFGRQSIWKVEKKDGNKFKFVRTEPLTAMNASLPWNFTEGGIEAKRTKVNNFFCLNAKNVYATPIILSLSSKSGFACGQKILSTLRAMAKSRPPVSSIERVCLLRPVKDVSGAGDVFYSWGFELGGATDTEQLAVATAAARDFSKQRAAFEAKAADTTTTADTDEIPF